MSKNLRSLGKILKRVWFDVILFLVIGLVLLFASNMPNHGIELFLYKGLLVSAGVLHATITRKVLFPYIDFETCDTYHSVFITVLYAVTIYAYSVGG